MKENGIYICIIEIPNGKEVKIVCKPLKYKGNEAFFLDTDERGNWVSYGKGIKDFATINDNGLLEEIKQQFQELSGYQMLSCQSQKIALAHNQSYQSIYRPIYTEHNSNWFVPFKDGKPTKEVYRDMPITNLQEYSNRLRQLEIVLNDLDNVFKVITPDRYNKKVYGHAIRDIIILSCTEIDMMMKDILKKNGLSKVRYTTGDYIKLLPALKLNDYQVGFYRYGMNSYSPFWRWIPKCPSQSIWWYNAYNNVKHDRELYFKQANLGNAINCVMAFVIILIAQYGYRNELWNESVGRIIRVDKEPQWDLKDFYFVDSNMCSPIHYPFP